MAVVTCHAFHTASPLGRAGVDLFFVISGFIIATCAHHRTPASFLADRAWRIYPLWLVAVIPWLVMSRQSTLVVIRSLSLWPIYGNRYIDPALGVGWTLSFEMLFYVGFAVALATRASLPLAVFSVCFVLGLKTSWALFWFMGSPLTFEFLLGVVIARTPTKQEFGLAAIACGALGLAVFPSIFWGQALGIGALYRVLCWGIPAALLVYGARCLEASFGKRIFDVPVLMGSASYSIYLFHELVLNLTPGFAGFALSLATGVAVYLTIERPLMRARPHWRFRQTAHLEGAIVSP
jgi:peptidoglycan/LPS O-acetylase OafA/YrhL